MCKVFYQLSPMQTRTCIVTIHSQRHATQIVLAAVSPNERLAPYVPPSDIGGFDAVSIESWLLCT